MLKPGFIDISHHQVIPESLVAAKQSGILGVIHKATEGKSYVDDKYAARKHLAADAGMLFGAYHFLRPGDMEDQAAFFVETAGLDPAMLYAADHEDARVSLGELKGFLAAVNDIIGRPNGCVIYSGHVLKEQLGTKPDAFITAHRLWLAQYSSSPSLPAGFTGFWGWQYTDKGTVPGINPPTDLNAYDGTADELAAEWSGSGVAPVPPEPAPDGLVIAGPAQLTITIPAGANVTVAQQSAE
jgi:lysozyme